MFKIQIDDDAILYDLKERESKAKDTKPLMRSIAGDLEDSTEENFRVEGRPRWERLKLSTKKRRLKKGKLGRILQVNEQLKNSIHSEYTDNTAIIGTNKKYARIHQKGGIIKHPGTRKGFGIDRYIKAHDIKIPARPYIKLTKSEENDITKKVEKYFD